MHDHHDEMKIGARVRLSPLGLKRSPRVAGSHSGVVVSAMSRTSFRILFDGRKRALTVHASYIESE
jgi:hypothetical protein